MKKAGRFAALLAAMIMFAGCLSGKIRRATCSGGIGAGVVGAAVLRAGGSGERPEPSDITVAEMRESEVESHLPGLSRRWRRRASSGTPLIRRSFSGISPLIAATPKLDRYPDHGRKLDRSLSVTIADSTRRGTFTCLI
jgi:hypothetical protein